MNPNFKVLGINGPAGSGKDLVADYFASNGIVKISFADPMKRFVKGAFGLSDLQLWGLSEERNKEFLVDDSWWFNAIGLLPDAFKEILNEVLVGGNRSKGYLSLMDWFNRLRREYPEKISARVILQTLGTEWGRAVDPLLWAKHTHKLIREMGTHPQKSYTKTAGLFIEPSKSTGYYTGAIIPDHRFRNEVELTQQAGGHVIRVRRLALQQETVGIPGHQSEAEQKLLPDEAFDLVLELEEFNKPDTGELDLGALHQALAPVFQEEAWKQGKGTKRRLAPS